MPDRFSWGFLYRQAFVPLQPAPSSIDLKGKTILITGANTGIGLEATKELIQHGASRIILAVRDLSKGEKAKAELAKLGGPTTIDVWPLDHDSFASIHACGARAAALDRLDIAILNAGNKPTTYRRSPTGHESTIQVNHLGPALLSLLLLAPLTRTARTTGHAARLTLVASEVHFHAPFPERRAPALFARLADPATFDPVWRYNASKLLNVLWARALAARVRAADVVVAAVNPGLCWSDLHRDDPGRALYVFRKLFARPAAQGGHALVDAAVAQRAEVHGGYLSEQRLTPAAPFVRSAEGEATQERVWKETVELLVKEGLDEGVVP